MQFTIKLVAQTLFSKFLVFLNENKGKNSLSDYVHILLHYFESFLAHCVSSTAHKNNRTSSGRTFLCCSPCCFGLSKDTKTSTTTYKPAAKSNNHNSNENNTKAVHNNNPFIGGGKEKQYLVGMYCYLFHTMTFSRKKIDFRLYFSRMKKLTFWVVKIFFFYFTRMFTLVFLHRVEKFST